MELAKHPLALPTQPTGTLPVVSTLEVAAATDAYQPRNAFAEFLSVLGAHEEMGAAISPFLFSASVWADIFLLTVLFFGLTLSASQSNSSGFFIIGAPIESGLISFLHIAAWPLIPLAAVGLFAKLWTRNHRAHEAIHVLCAIETVAAVLAGIAPALFIALIAVEALVWVVITIVVVAICIAVVLAFLSLLTRS